MVNVKVGETLKVDALLEKLVSWGFEHSDFVYGPGQYAVRGGILDIYSFGNEKPYRMELFGDEVDSIRLFDPETQLSERKLMQVTLIANMDTRRHYPPENEPGRLPAGKYRGLDQRSLLCTRGDRPDGRAAGGLAANRQQGARNGR